MSLFSDCSSESSSNMSSATDQASPEVPPFAANKGQQFRWAQIEAAGAHEEAQQGAALGWLKYVFGVGPADNSGQPASKLIVPLSRFNAGWLMLTCCFLFYTAWVVPPMIAFYWLEDPCVPAPTLTFDAALDAFFIMDIGLSFVTGIYHLNGEYIDDMGTVAAAYLKGWFVFDVLTSIPVTFFELSVIANCNQATATEDSLDASPAQLRFMRVLKPLRYFKLARIMKIGRGGGLRAALMDYFGISPMQRSLFACVLILFLCIHLVACFWWWLKVVSYGIHESEEDAQLAFANEFLLQQGWVGDSMSDLTTARGKLDAYTISVYLATMTLTTVGYGDITADNSFERCGYVAIFIIGAFIWGNLLGDIAEIRSSACLRDKEKSDKIQATLDFLVAHDTPKHLRTTIVQWTRFHEDHQDENLMKKTMVNELPPSLQKPLVKHLYSWHLTRIYIYTCIHIHTYIYTYIHIYMYIYIYI